MSLFIDMPVTADTLVVGISLPARWANAINRAAEILRQRHPGADDAELTRLMLIHGVVAVIDGENGNHCPRNEDDDTAQVIINTAKAEVDFMKVTGNNTGTGFIPSAVRPVALVSKAQSETATGTKTVTPVAGGSITTHRLK